MKNIKELELGNFISNNKVFLVRCPKCKKENYSINVASGICTWCGLDGNKYYLKSKGEK
jgi:hypothetical protein